MSAEDDLPPVLPEMQDETDDFTFESESYALQNNKDYKMLLKTLVRLEAQKIQAIKGLEDLHEIREAILKDPFAFVSSLQNGESLNLPRPIDIIEVPEIEWEKYDIHSIIQTFRPKTRRLAKENNTNISAESSEVPNAEKGAETAKAVVKKTEKERSDTFNLPWTQEEQRKLEELLIKYPDEPMSSKRWIKISKELGTRTLLQVQSRVQKYFIALKKEGLPVPGKDPKRALVGNLTNRKRGFGGSNLFNTYMRAFDFEAPSPASAGRESEKRGSESCDRVTGLDIKENNCSDEDDDISEELRDTEEFQQMRLLKRAKKLKLEEMRTGEVKHYGYKCDGCSRSPICGIRWHCLDCPQRSSVDLCEYCARNFRSESHLPSHILRPIKAMSLRDTSSLHR